MKPPKSKASNRTVPLVPLAVEVLRWWREEQAQLRAALGDRWAAGDRVCTTPNSKAMTPGALVYWFKRALERAGLPRSVRFHDLRHSVGTLLARQGAHATAIAAVLGHASVAFTSQVYVHPGGPLERHAMDRLARLWSQRQTIGKPENEPRAATPEG